MASGGPGQTKVVISLWVVRPPASLGALLRLQSQGGAAGRGVTVVCAL